MLVNSVIEILGFCKLRHSYGQTPSLDSVNSVIHTAIESDGNKMQLFGNGSACDYSEEEATSSFLTTVLRKRSLDSLRKGIRMAVNKGGLCPKEAREISQAVR